MKPYVAIGGSEPLSLKVPCFSTKGAVVPS